MTVIRCTVLGCGSSGGVPRLGNVWGACCPNNPRNRRRRCSLLVEQAGSGGTTAALVDISPDIREQLLAVGVGAVDGVAVTHAHADHVNGIDDLRVLAMNSKRPVPLWTDPETGQILLRRFGYAISAVESTTHPPFLDMRTMTGPVTISGAGGAIELIPFPVHHGAIMSLGFRIGNLAYIPDVSEIPDHVWPLLADLDCWIVDALQPEPHKAHAHLEKALAWIARAGPRQAYLTNMGTRMDYEEVARITPKTVMPAHDGLVIGEQG
ncbi:MAG: MBL fold metallo-hydrolase [Rhodobacteraceae bacterium]|nr:MBL fold metallo-hydrolase [Paracoccaceae bacterium]